MDYLGGIVLGGGNDLRDDPSNVAFGSESGMMFKDLLSEIIARMAAGLTSLSLSL